MVSLRPLSLRPLSLLLAGLFTSLSAPQVAAQGTAAPWDPFPTDFPFATSNVGAKAPAKNVMNKAVSIRLGSQAAFAFDTDLLRMGAAWTGAFLTPTGVALDTSHGAYPQVAGELKVGTRPGPGWANANGRFEDPRKPQPFGPLPESWGRWDGLYVVGDAVVLGYTVLGAKIHEQPAAITRDGRTVFARTFQIAEAPRPLGLVVADVEGQGPAQTATGAQATLIVTRADRATGVSLFGAPATAKLEATADGRLLLRLPAGKLPGLFKVVTWSGPVAERAAFEALARSTPAPAMVDFRKGGKRHWDQNIVTKGERGTGPGPYVVDRLTTPFPGTYHRSAIADWKDNVYRRRIMVGGFDFFADGKRAAMATWEGDVWIVEGIDDSLGRLVWRRFASGGFETLGLKIVNDVIYTSGRDQITRYHDLNGDGEADHYENFNNQVTSSTGFHEFQFDLHTDSAGNFYTAKAAPVRGGGQGFGGGGGNGDVTAFAGTVQRISKDGKRREVIASGLRAPNGIGVGPDGQITTGDNEGTWVPACPINWVKPGSFHGVEDTAHKSPVPAYTPPLCWISKSYDNSGGSQVWVTSDKWGPWKGELLHLSYGRAAVYLVMKQKAGDLMQGGIVRVIGGSDAVQMSGSAQKLTSSAMRGRFNPGDGQLYVTGLSGWQSDAVSVTGFDRIRYTGKDVHSVRELKVTSAGVHLTFSHPLDPTSISDQNFSGERWNYRRTSSYGSPEFSVSDPETRGHDRLDITEAELLPDGHTVRLAVDDLRPAHQMLLKFKVKAADGTRIAQTVMHSIHVVPNDPNAKAGSQVAGRTSKPGLHLTLSAAGGGPDVVPASNVALYVAAGRAASPLIAPGAFQAVWEGTLAPELRGEHTFAAELSGKLTIEVNGKSVYEATGKAKAGGSGKGVPIAGKPVMLEKRDNRFRAVFTAPARGDAFVRLRWRDERGGLFEPLPAKALRHAVTDVPVGRAQAETVRQGRELFLEHRCARCHMSKLPAGGAPELAMDAPSFDSIGTRRNKRWMAEWIAQPTRRGARMPALLHGATAQTDARAIAAFLGTLGTEARSGGEQGDPRAAVLAASGDRLWNDLNCGGCHSPVMQMMSDDGKLSLTQAGAKFAPGALVAYLKAPEAHYAWTRMPNFRLTDDEAQALAAHIGGTSGGGGGRRQGPDGPQAIARGRDLVQSTGCLACHGLKGAKNNLAIVDLAARFVGSGARGARAPSPRSCIDGANPAARFGFTPAQSAALRAFVEFPSNGATNGFPAAVASLRRHAPTEFLQRQISALQCNACHGQLDGFPALEMVGDKLRPEWSAAFIAGRVPYKPRPETHADGQPWLAARMPSFAAHAPFLAEALAAAHGVAPKTAPEPHVDRKSAQLGEALVSATGGFSCVTCHGVGGATATQVFETEGINLVYASERLLPEYFRRWMRNPLRVDPQTKMPVYFDDEGKSPLDKILGGDGDKQIEALWHFVRQAAASKRSAKTVVGAPP